MGTPLKGLKPGFGKGNPKVGSKKCLRKNVRKKFKGLEKELGFFQKGSGVIKRVVEPGEWIQFGPSGIRIRPKFLG